MARVSPTATAALAVLAGATEPATSPLSARTRAALARAIARARQDILDAVAREGVTAVAARLGVARSTLALWRAPGGWLRAAQTPAQGAPDDADG